MWNRLYDPIVVSHVMQVLGDRNTGIVKREINLGDASNASAEKGNSQSPPRGFLSSPPASFHFVRLIDEGVRCSFEGGGHLVSVPALPEASSCRRGAVTVAALLGRAILSVHSGRAAGE